ncbi:ABC transporter permease [Comamonas faecalis]|uniref:ABC transporter permease n=1 Tax=Comamonas faecalis TaxID=1387849 RepID=A0ABP7RPW8_9BURK
MQLSGLIVQLLNALAGASSLFLVAAGLSLIFGVTRIVNFAHGSLYMLGVYLAYSLAESLAPVLGAGWGFWLALPLAALAVGLLGALIEALLLRRLYPAPELLQLLATFALVLVVRDGVLALWGPDELLGPRAPGLRGAVSVLGRQFPAYDLFLIAAGPLVLLLVWLLLTRTRFGTLVRAATQDREMVSALGVQQAWLFTAVFALGALLAGLGGALQLPRESANLDMDLNAIGAAFVVVVVGGLGSLPGAYLAALLISLVKALCIWLGQVTLWGVPVNLSKATLVVDFAVMAAVLVWRPWGLLGRPQALVRSTGEGEAPLRPAGRGARAAWALLALALLALPWLGASDYTLVLGIELAVAALLAASLHFIMGPGGMHSFGHAAYFGAGAYGAGLALKALGLPMAATLVAGPLLAALLALVFGWLAVRLSGVYLAMLTLALAQIAWAVTYQWDDLTGGSNGLTGIWPASALADTARYYLLVLALVLAGLWLLRRMLHAPLGLALRAARDAPLRAEAIGVDVRRVQWLAFVIAGAFAGVAGALFVYSKGSISPEALGIGKSIDALVMVLLGGVQTLAGPVAGAVGLTWLQDAVARGTDYWRAVLGAIILVLVLVFPQGLVGGAQQLWRRWAARRGAAAQEAGHG